MEIKVTYQGELVGKMNFHEYSAIELMRRMGFASFTVRSEVKKYEHFALFMDEDEGEYIKFYPDRSFKVNNESSISYDVLVAIKDILEYYIDYHANEEESEQHEKESE